MALFEAVLTATDFSDNARHAAERAAMICKATGALRGGALHVIPSSWLEDAKRFISPKREVEGAMMSDASRPLDDLVGGVRERTGFALEPMVRIGGVVDTIVREFAAFDLLVLGAHGRHRLQDLTLGTTAERLLRMTRKPVLVVKRAPAGNYRRVFVAVDFSPHSRTAFAFGGAVAPGAEVSLAHIFEVPFEGKMTFAGVPDELISEYRVRARAEAEAAMQRFIDEAEADVAPGSLDRFIEHGDHVARKLLDRAVRIDADLVVVGKHGASLADRLLVGSVTLRLLGECPCDVLVTQVP
jgi:nucleotide-binding universal stress UspA family protein